MHKGNLSKPAFLLRCKPEVSEVWPGLASRVLRLCSTRFRSRPLLLTPRLVSIALPVEETERQREGTQMESEQLPQATACLLVLSLTPGAGRLDASLQRLAILCRLSRRRACHADAFMAPDPPGEALGIAASSGVEGSSWCRNGPDGVYSGHIGLHF